AARHLVFSPPALSPNPRPANLPPCFLCHGSAQGDLRHVIEVGRRGLDLRITQQDESNTSAGVEVVTSKPELVLLCRSAAGPSDDGRPRPLRQPQHDLGKYQPRRKSDDNDQGTERKLPYPPHPDSS